jgi:phosphatidylserine/phosphatidylglycerophosphate/cardiolipin synthase-like enzyme
MRFGIALCLVFCGCDVGLGDDTLPTDDAGDAVDLTVPPTVDLAGVDLYGVHPTADLTMLPLQLTTAVTVHVMPDEGDTPSLNAIKNAKKSINVEVYLLTTNTFISALTAAKGRGVTVKVILEQHPQAGDNTGAFNTLTGAGVLTAWSNPVFTFTHEKAMIIDGTTLWAMTSNLSAASFTSNREYQLVDTDPADIAEAQAVFDADWARTTPTVSKLVIANNNAAPKLNSFFATAGQSLDIEWEELTDNTVGFAIQQRAKAGVATRIILPSGADTTLAGALKASGVQVRLLTNPYLHAKMIVADHDHGFIGSENATFNSLNQNRELGVLWSNAQVGQICETAFNKDWAAAAPF